MSGRGGRDRVEAGSGGFECVRVRLTEILDGVGLLERVLLVRVGVHEVAVRARALLRCLQRGGGRARDQLGAAMWGRKGTETGSRARGEIAGVPGSVVSLKGPHHCWEGSFGRVGGIRAPGLRAKGGGLPETDAGPIVTSSRVVDGPAMARDELARRIYHAGATRLARPRGGGPRDLARQPS